MNGIQLEIPFEEYKDTQLEIPFDDTQEELFKVFDKLPPFGLPKESDQQESKSPQKDAVR